MLYVHIIYSQDIPILIFQQTEMLLQKGALRQVFRMHWPASSRASNNKKTHSNSMQKRSFLEKTFVLPLEVTTGTRLETVDTLF